MLKIYVWSDGDETFTPDVPTTAYPVWLVAIRW